MLFFNSNYTPQYGKYLLSLDDLIQEDHVNMYNKDILSQIGYYDNHLVAFPIYIQFFVLYSNKKYLDRYNKTIPKTWDELIETSKYILNHEREIANTDLIGYTGLFFDDDLNSLNTLTEFIYSCRESKESPIPDLKSQTTVNALKLIKKIKEEINFGYIYQALRRLFDENTLFIKYYYIPYFMQINSPYYISNMPGLKDGLSGTTLFGTNIGIFGNIDEERKKAAVEALKFITSEEMQKYFVLNNDILSGISALYDDKEVCTTVKCDLFNNVQIITPSSDIVNNNYIMGKYVNYFYDYLYGYETLEDVLNEMNYLTGIAYKECQAEIQKSMSCIEKIYSFIEEKQNVCIPSSKGASAEKCKNTIKQDLDNVCKVFENGECKDFISEEYILKLINNENCKYKNDIIKKLEQITAFKSAYLIGCNKNDSGNLCPLGKYVTTNAIDFVFTNFEAIKRLINFDYRNKNYFETYLAVGNDILSILPVLNDLYNIFIESCNDTSCSKYITEIDKYISEAKETYERNQNVNLTKQYPEVFELYDNYINDIKNKQCNILGFVQDDNGVIYGHSFPSIFIYIGLFIFVYLFQF